MSTHTIKVGDMHRLLYADRYYRSGLNISGKLQPPEGNDINISFSEVETTGVYYYDFNTVNCTTGIWRVIVMRRSVALAGQVLNLVEHIPREDIVQMECKGCGAPLSERVCQYCGRYYCEDKMRDRVG